MPESPRQILITREPEVPPDEGGPSFATRHPELAYVFGPTIRAFYVVGCLALDLLAPLQVVELLPGQELLSVPILVAAFAGLAYVEYQAYRRLWPAPRSRREVVAVAGPRRL